MIMEISRINNARHNYWELDAIIALRIIFSGLAGLNMIECFGFYILPIGFILMAWVMWGVR